MPLPTPSAVWRNFFEPSEFAAPVVAAASGIPLVVHGWGLPLPAGLVAAGGEAAAPMWKERGLAAPDGGGMCDGILIDLCPRSLDPGDGPEHRGPLLTMAPCVARRVEGPAGRRIAYVTLGTAGFARDTSLFAAAARALTDADLDVLITVGPYGDLDAVAAAAPSARVERFLDQDKILPACAVAVCHGGSGPSSVRSPTRWRPRSCPWAQTSTATPRPLPGPAPGAWSKTSRKDRPAPGIAHEVEGLLTALDAHRGTVERELGRGSSFSKSTTREPGAHQRPVHNDRRRAERERRTHCADARGPIRGRWCLAAPRHRIWRATCPLLRERATDGSG